MTSIKELKEVWQAEKKGLTELRNRRKSIAAELSEKKQKAAEYRQGAGRFILGGGNAGEVADKVSQLEQEIQHLVSALDVAASHQEALEDSVNKANLRLRKAQIEEAVKRAGDVYLEKAGPLIDQLASIQEEILEIYQEAGEAQAAAYPWPMDQGRHVYQRKRQQARHPADVLGRSLEHLQAMAESIEKRGLGI